MTDRAVRARRHDAEALENDHAVLSVRVSAALDETLKVRGWLESVLVLAMCRHARRRGYRSSVERPFPTDGGDSAALAAELDGVRGQVARLRAENARLLRLLELTPGQAMSPGPVQTALFHQPPGPVHAGSSPAEKVRFFRALFAARADVYATRWENTRTGQSGWIPAVAGGWRKGSRQDRQYLPLTDDVLTAHLSGESRNLIAAPLQGRCRRDRIPQCRDPGAVRGPMGVPVQPEPPLAARGRAARRQRGRGARR